MIQKKVDSIHDLTTFDTLPQEFLLQYESALQLKVLYLAIAFLLSG